MDIKQQIQETIVNTLTIDPGELKEGLSLEDALGVDSTEIVELTVALTKKFKIQIADKELSKKSTLADIEKLISSKLK